MVNRRGWLGRSIDNLPSGYSDSVSSKPGKWIVNSRLAWSLVSRIERVRGQSAD